MKIPTQIQKPLKILVGIFVLSSVIYVLWPFLYIGTLRSTSGNIVLSVDHNGHRIRLDCGTAVASVGKMIFWEKESDQLLWALNFTCFQDDELIYGEIPPPVITELGYKSISARQQYPDGGEKPVPLPINKEVYVYIEYVVDTVLGPSLDSAMYEIRGSADSEYLAVKKILPKSRLIPSEVEALWEY